MSFVRSKQRVADHGEVFTPAWMVEAMLNLVKDETERIDSRFLEPACGSGNFLVQILRRKLAAVELKYGKSSFERQHYALLALMCIYGIELLEDNHRDAKKTMLAEFLRFHKEHGIPSGPDTSLRQAAAFLLDTNVVRGNTLAALDWRGEEIQFSWWNRITGAPGMVQREPFTLDYRLRRADGAYRWAIDAGRPRFDEAGAFLGYIGSVIDITERKESEQALQESENRLAGIINSAMDAVISVDERQRIILFNSAAEKMFGYSSAEMIGQPISRLIPERFRDSHEENIRRFAEGQPLLNVVDKQKGY